mmetsp:Transcript_91064/g.195267  ORF Transcript_91064/g.195267 Transcript_91064/m.195267 type:complete len:237 (+) Transcript_91064:57-767(+)
MCHEAWRSPGSSGRWSRVGEKLDEVWRNPGSSSSKNRLGASEAWEEENPETRRLLRGLQEQDRAIETLREKAASHASYIAILEMESFRKQEAITKLRIDDDIRAEVIALAARLHERDQEVIALREQVAKEEHLLHYLDQEELSINLQPSRGALGAGSTSIVEVDNKSMAWHARHIEGLKELLVEERIMREAKQAAKLHASDGCLPRGCFAGFWSAGVRQVPEAGKAAPLVLTDGEV